MINITKLLTDSFESYKKNFRNIILMALPIFILSSIGTYYAMAIKATQVNRNSDLLVYKDFNMLYFIIGTVVYILALLAVGLFFAPAFNRAIQKNEDDKYFDIKAGYNFQKRNIWKWIKVNLWGMVYFIWRLLPYLTVSALLVVGLGLLNITTKDLSNIITNIIISIAVITIFVGMVLNITRFVFFRNVFFAKDHMKAKNAVIESVSLGKTKNLEIWKAVLSLFLFSLMMFVLFTVVSLIVAFIIHSFGSNNFSIIDIIISPMMSAFIVTPITLIIVAKAYNKVRGHGHVSVEV